MEPLAFRSLAEAIAAVGTPDDECNGFADAAGAAWQGGFELVRGGSAASGADRDRSVLTATMTLPINPGTIGHHKLLCGRPCLHFKHNHCSNGDAFNFCHAPHTRTSNQLDKQRRQALRTMPLQDMYALMLPLVVEIACAADGSVETERALQHLTSVCGLNSVAAQLAVDRRLVKGLSSMLPSLVLATFVDLTRRHHAGEVTEAAEALVKQLVASSMCPP